MVEDDQAYKEYLAQQDVLDDEDDDQFASSPFDPEYTQDRKPHLNIFKHDL